MIAFSSSLFADPQQAVRSGERTEIDRAFDRLYNYDFAGAQVLVDQYLAKHPNDPWPYNVRAAGYLFQELGRLKILEAEFFADDERVGGRKKMEPDPAVKARFEKAVGEAKARAEKLVAENPKDIHALFNMSFQAGLRSDYSSLIDKKYIQSFGLIKESANWASKVLALDPNNGDAMLTMGMTEYIVGSVPFLLRWAVRVENVKGDKKQAIRTLNRVAATARYLGPFARIMLSLAYVRDNQWERAADTLAKLSTEYPENKLIQTELEKIRQKLQRSGRN